MAHFLNPLLEAPAAPWGLRNATRGTWVATNLLLAFDSPGRRRGLLALNQLDPGRGLILAPSSAIHTCFMAFSIDVIFVARDGRVIKTVASMAPGRVSAAWRGFAVVELSTGSLNRSQTTPGDVLLPARIDTERVHAGFAAPDVRLARTR